MENKNLAQMSGEESFSQSPKLPLNTIRFNGKKGRFSLVELLKPKVMTDKGERHPEVDLGESVNVIFLKIRRKLVEKRKKKPEAGDPKLMSTNEHNTKNEFILLYKDRSVEFGTTDELKQKYPDLRTQQIVYAIWNGQVVRINFKGASLGSNAKAKDVHDFYSYIGSFKENLNARDGVKDHFYEFVTTLKSIEEQGDLGEYYTVTFEKGDSLSNEGMKDVENKMIEIFNYTQQSDLFYKDKINLLKTGKKIEIKKEEEDIETVEYPEEELNPEDIPF